MDKSGKHSKTGMILTAAGGVLILLSAFILLRIFGGEQRAEEDYSDARDEYTQSNEIVSLYPAEDPAADDMPAEEKQEPGDGEPEWYEDIAVDVAALKAQYPEAIGWLYFEDGLISYPLMYSGDNEKYLHKDYTGEESKAGAIFLDGESTPDLSDVHNLIYGHNMADESMFGKLHKYTAEEDYLKDHRYFRIYTEDAVYRYEIFAYGDISAYSKIYYAYGPSPKDLPGLIEELNRLAPADSETRAGFSDRIVTLSTCTAGDDNRLIVSAVMVDEAEL